MDPDGRPRDLHGESLMSEELSGVGDGPFAPVFETESKEIFTYPQLRANFHIVNAAVLTVRIETQGKLSVPFEVSASYEDAQYFSAVARDAAPLPSATVTTKI